MSNFTDGDRKRMYRGREGKRDNGREGEKKRENRSNTEKFGSIG